jgi:hypothetical protein
MNPGRVMSAQLAFPLAAVVSGLASGLSCLVPGFAIIFPGLFFGVAIAFAVHHKVGVLDPLMGVVLIVLSMFGYWIAGIATLLSIRFLGNGNILACGSIAGGVRACVTAVALAISSKYFQSIRVVAVTTLAGAVCGVICGGVIYLHDHKHMPHPLDSILMFLIWQVGVASVIPSLRKVQTDRDSTNSEVNNS